MFVIFLLHILICAWALVAPFSSKEAKLSYILIMPVVAIHWMTNDQSCCLTLLESKLRGVGTTESFIHKLVTPVYNAPEETTAVLVWAYVIASWIYAVCTIQSQ